MKEKNMFEPLIEYLKNQGYEILEQHRGYSHGTDIIASKNGKKLNIELKGDSSEPYVDFGTALFQVMKKMKDDSQEHAIAISEKYIRYAEQCEYPLKKLGIKIFVINETNKIKQL